MDSEVKELLEKNEIQSLDEELREEFQKNGVIVEDDLDELEMVNAVYEESKYEALTTTLHVITTYDCNLACTYCHEGKGDQETKYMDEKTAKIASKFIENLTAENFSKALAVELFGGEPMLNMPVNLQIAEELSTWCEENDKVFFLITVTNGTLMTEKNVEDLAQYNSGFLITLDGPKEFHDRRRVYKDKTGTFDDIIAGMHRAHDLGLEISARIHIDESNMDHIGSLYQLLRDEGLNKVKISFRQVFHTSPACLSNMYCIPDIRGLKAVNQLYSMARGMSLGAEAPEEPSLPGACPAQKVSYYTLDPYLRLYKCAILPPSEKNAVGYINTEDSRPVFSSVHTDFFSRDLISQKECTDCKLLPSCRGGCPAEIFIAHKTTHKTVCRKAELYQTVGETVMNFARRHV